jgi:hypothetical protein
MNITTRKVGIKVRKYVLAIREFNFFNRYLLPVKTLRKSSIKLTKEEFGLMICGDYPKIKQRVIGKMCQRFDLLGALLAEKLAAPASLTEPWKVAFKTTRGENYRLLPYTVLDFPRIKGPDFALCCRTMFWWGKYFSLNVILRTDIPDTGAFVRNLKAGGLKKVRVYHGNDLWEQDLGHVDFMKLKNLDETTFVELMSNRRYIKICRKVSFAEMDQLETIALEFYTAVLAAL